MPLTCYKKKCGLVIPKEWEGVPRMSIDVRREYVLADGLREAKKSRFESAKLLRYGCSVMQSFQDSVLGWTKC